MKLKNIIIALAIGSITLSNNVWCYADETPSKAINILTEEYPNENSLMEKEKLRIEQEILEEIKNNPVTLSEAEVNPMGLPDIDPVTNPASDNWLTREVAKKVNKSNITSLTQRDFNKITSISYTAKEVTEIPEEIGNLFNLHNLSLDYNRIKEIPSQVSNLIGLQVLSLSSNQINIVPYELFNLTNLKSLSLKFNKITEIPSQISNLVNLEVLYLAGNNIINIFSKICNLTNLEILDLRKSNISIIPSEIKNLVNLRYLELGDNLITKVPPEFSSLINLKNLDLGYNQLNEINSIFNLVNLEYLLLPNNQITKIPSNISNLANLKILGLSFNRITEIPSQISSLSNLQMLSLQDNQITQIPSEISNLTNLEFLSLTSNQIAKVPSEISYIQRLWIDTNKIMLNNKLVNPNEEFSIQNPLNVFGNPIVPNNISNGGIYNQNDNTITWTSSNINSNETFSFNVKFSEIYEKIYDGEFSGIVTVPTVIKEKPLSLTFSNTSVNQSIYMHDTLSIPIFLKGTGNYYALDTQIEYNSELLEFKGYSAKKGLKAYYFSNENNTLRYILASQGKDNPINSSVSDIVYLNFVPKKTGITDIKINSGKVANLDNEINISDLGSVSITIEEQTEVKDINRDGKFTLIDLAIDSYYYGMNVNETDNTKYEADIISDGKIDDTDLKEIVKHILNNPDYSK